MLIKQTVVGKQLVHVVTVVEALLDAAHKHLHLRCAIIRCDALSESTILATILKRHHQLVVTLEDGCKDGGFGERIASYYGTSQMKVLVGGIKKGLYDRYDVHELLADNRLLDEQIVEDVLSIVD